MVSKIYQMPSLLDKLSVGNVDVQERIGRFETLDVDAQKAPFKWMFEYTVYKDNDDSWFEKRIIALLEPFGDVVIRDYTAKSDIDEFKSLYQKKHVFFHRPTNFRTDARIMCHLLLNAARANHPFMFTMYLISDKVGLSVRYAAIAPMELSQFNTLYNTFPYPTGDLANEVKVFTDASIPFGKYKNKAIDVIACELNRIREHYLNMVVV